MATSQEQAATHLVLSNEDKVVLDEVMKELDSLVLPKDTTKLELQAMTRGVIANRSPFKLELKYIHQYSGHFTTSGPAQVLNERSFNVFRHQGTAPKGSKVGVAYAANGLQWIMAWSVPLQPEESKLPVVLNKVYVETGPDGPIDWESIENKLDTSGGHTSKYPGAKAIIYPGSHAKLVTVFTDPRPRN